MCSNARDPTSRRLAKMTLVFRLSRPVLLGLIVAMIGTAAPAHGQSVQWVRQFGTMDYDNALAVTTDPSGDVYVGGTTRAALPGQTSAGKDDAFLAKYDLSG